MPPETNGQMPTEPLNNQGQVAPQPQPAQYPPQYPPQYPQNNQAPNQYPPQPNPVDAFKNNPKFMVTLKTFMIYGTLVYVFNEIVSIIISSFHLTSYFSPINIGSVVVTLVTGVIVSAISGAVFYFIYGWLNNWIKNNGFLSRHIHDIFTLFWKPFLLGTIISALFGLLSMLGLGSLFVSIGGAYGAASFGFIFIGWIITFVAHIFIYYWYAKSLSKKLTPYYSW